MRPKDTLFISLYFFLFASLLHLKVGTLEKQFSAMTINYELWKNERGLAKGEKELEFCGESCWGRALLASGSGHK